MESAEPIHKSEVAEEQIAKTQAWIRRLATVIGGILLVTGLFTSVLIVTLTLKADKQRQYIVECTTPGHHKPTEKDPTTGNNCYDRQQSRGAEFVVIIGNDIEERVCNRIQEAFNQTEHGPIVLKCHKEGS